MNEDFARPGDKGRGLDEARRRIADCAEAQADTLDLGSLRLDKLPVEILELTWLRHLYLGGDANARKSPHYPFAIGGKSGNALGALPSALFNALAQLETLDVARNGIRKLPQAITGLTRLTTLNLGANNLGDDGARAIAGLKNLTTLGLAFNSHAAARRHRTAGYRRIRSFRGTGLQRPRRG